ncbi:hypothetical protein ACFL59_15395, partial [Planctomycetota bacterium]
IAFIIAETGLRPGNARSAQHGKYGVSTFLKEHVSIAGGAVSFAFTGKHGQPNVAEIRDPDFASAFRKHLDGRGDGPAFDVDSADARTILPKGLKLKDMRTLVATRTAREQVASWPGPPPPLTGNEKTDNRTIARALKAMSTVVAERLNNTPPVARASYIHPEVFKAWIAEVRKGRGA